MEDQAITIGGSTPSWSKTTAARDSEADQLRAEIEALRRERQRLVRLAAATDDPVPEVVDALRTKQPFGTRTARQR